MSGMLSKWVSRFLVAAAVIAASSTLPNVADAAIKRQLVQKKFFQVTTGTSVSVTFRRPTVAGHLVVAYVVWDNSGAVTVTDSTGNTYASAVGPTQSGGTNAQLFYAGNIAGGITT